MLEKVLNQNKHTLYIGMKEATENAAEISRAYCSENERFAKTTLHRARNL